MRWRILRAAADLQIELAARRLRAAISARTIERRFNPNWRLQPRLPRGLGQRVSGTWAEEEASPFHGLPLLPLRNTVARSILDQAARDALPLLHHLPQVWSGGPPKESDFNDATRRIGPNSPRRPGHPLLRFRSFEELKRVLGPAGPGMVWHHIVEQRLADNGRFPLELIHSTDNVIRLEYDVHLCINGFMSAKQPYSGNLILRAWAQELTFEEQYDLGIDLIHDCREMLGYAPLKIAD